MGVGKDSRRTGHPRGVADGVVDSTRVLHLNQCGWQNPKKQCVSEVCGMSTLVLQSTKGSPATSTQKIHTASAGGYGLSRFHARSSSYNHRRASSSLARGNPTGPLPSSMHDNCSVGKVLRAQVRSFLWIRQHLSLVPTLVIPSLKFSCVHLSI